MTHPAIAQVEAYWDGLRGDRVAPMRADVDPRGIEQALETAFVLERIAPGVARFRLAGMHLNDLMGMEVRGMPVTSFFTPGARHTISDALEHLFEQPAKIRFQLKGDTGGGRGDLTAQMLLLPLRSDLGDISRALGCLVSEGTPAPAPNRFSVTESEIVGLIGSTTTAAGYRKPAPVKDADVQIAEPSAPFRRKGESKTKPEPEEAAARRAHLRLIHDSDRDQ